MIKNSRQGIGWGPTPIPNTPRVTMADTVTGKRAELFATPGYIPTPDDVAAVIEARGRWGDAPSFTLCTSCRWPIFNAGGSCPVCGAVDE